MMGMGMGVDGVDVVLNCSLMGDSEAKFGIPMVPMSSREFGPISIFFNLALDFCLPEIRIVLFWHPEHNK